MLSEVHTEKTTGMIFFKRHMTISLKMPFGCSSRLLQKNRWKSAFGGLIFGLGSDSQKIKWLQRFS